VSLIAVAVQGRGLVDPSEPVFYADDESILRGSVAFETVRSYGGVPFLLDRHIERLRHSIESLALPAVDGVEELVAQVGAASPPDHALRIYRTERILVATTAPIPAGLEEERARGTSLRSIEMAPAELLAGTKSTSYGAAFAARREAERLGADEALFVSEGVVLECATANIWWRRGETVFTPATRAGVLGGVTRGALLELEPATEGAFPFREVVSADEAFTTSSIREVMPVVELDGAPIGDGKPGTAARRLQAALRLRSTP
jgi:branched-subunit amino acid aminotransferase/4-amino-4-deoxychorismate lyase